MGWGRVTSGVNWIRGLASKLVLSSELDLRGGVEVQVLGWWRDGWVVVAGV